MGVHSDPTGSSSMKTMRGQLGLRSSPLAPTSAKLTTQYLVMDHMKNHYSKITKAKPAIDNKAPRSISSSQKMRERREREGKAKGRPASGMSVNHPVRPYSAMTYDDDDVDFYDEAQWGDIEDEEDKLAREIMRTTLRPHSSRPHGSSNATYGGSTQSPYYSARYDRTSQPRPASARSSARSVHSSMGRSALPTKTAGKQKTYDGDVIEKRAHVFTQPDKPFTPRLLKSNRQSRLAQTKHYTAPPQKRDGDENTSVKEKEGKSPAPKPRAKPRVNNTSLDKTGEMTETLMFESLQSRDFSNYNDRQQVVPPLNISLDADNVNWIKEQASRAEIRAKSGTLRSSNMSKINENHMLDTTDMNQTGNMTLTSGSLNKTNRGNITLQNSQRLSTDIKPVRPALHQNFNTLKKNDGRQREEELQYVEFIKEVTDDVLNRGVFTDRVLKQVFEMHIAKKRGKLNEERMRSMLSQVRQDLEIKEDDSDLTGSSTFNTTSSLGSKLHTKYGKSRFGEQTFGSTMDSQNTYNFKDTSSGDMFSTIHSEREELSATQALQSYQMDITRHEENEDIGAESPGEIAPDSEDEFQKTSHALMPDDKSTHSVKSSRSHRSDHSKASHTPLRDDKSVKSVKSLQSQQSAYSKTSNKSIQSANQSGNSSRPSPRPRAKSQIEDGNDNFESSEGQSTLRAEDDEEDADYGEDEFEESDEERKVTHRTSDEDF